MAQTKKKGRSAPLAQGTMKHFGPRLRELRQARRMSQCELARVLDIDYMRVNRYERGINAPSAETIVKITRALQITADELLMGESDAQPPAIQSVLLFERFRVLDAPPKEARETALEIRDGVIAKHELARLADRIKRSA